MVPDAVLRAKAALLLFTLQCPSCPGTTAAQFDQTQRLQQAEIILQSSLGGLRL
jgi:hypothetical protein